MMDEYEYTGGEVVDFHGVPMRWAGEMIGAEMISEMQEIPTPPSLIYRNTNWIFHAGKAAVSCSASRVAQSGSCRR